MSLKSFFTSLGVIGTLTIYTGLLIAGLLLSQVLPGQFDSETHGWLKLLIKLATMTALAYIMVRVGNEFSIEKQNILKDYAVAMIAAGLPWLLCAGYFIFVLNPPEMRWNIQVWKESLLECRFASPTSAGVLFTMLAAAGLGATWVFHKARLLAILDDLDTLLFLVLLQFLLLGIKVQLLIVLGVMFVLLASGLLASHRLNLPRSWPWVLVYSAVLVALSESADQINHHFDKSTPLHLEVLLPAFVLGWLMKQPQTEAEAHKEHDREKVFGWLISAVFLFLVGLSMQQIDFSQQEISPEAMANLKERYPGVSEDVLARKNAFPGWEVLAIHVVVVTILSNFGKMVPFARWYQHDASLRERLALAVSMFPRGEVGAGVLALSIAEGVSGPTITVAMLSLALNLLLTWVFVLFVSLLIPKYKTPRDVLHAIVSRTGVLDYLMAGRGSLEYAAYITEDEVAKLQQNTLAPKDLQHKAVALGQIGRLMERLNIPGNEVAQVEAWDKLVPQAIHQLQTLQQHMPKTGYWAGQRISRIILDVEVGGYFVARLREGGYIVAASLDQAVMDNDSADRELQQIIRGLRYVRRRQRQK